MTTRHIVYAPLSALAPAELNPKMHDQPGIIASLTRYGWTDPCIVDERTGRLVAGHGRREAAIAMKANGDPCPGGVFVDDDGDWLVPVMRGWASRDDTEAKAYVIADNELTVAGGWHMKSLHQLLEEVVTDDASLLETTGLTPDRIDEILRRGDPDATSLTASDDLPWDDDAPEVADEKPAKPEKEHTPTMHTCPACGFESEV